MCSTFSSGNLGHVLISSQHQLICTSSHGNRALSMTCVVQAFYFSAHTCKPTISCGCRVCRHFASARGPSWSPSSNIKQPPSPVVVYLYLAMGWPHTLHSLSVHLLPTALRPQINYNLKWLWLRHQQRKAQNPLQMTNCQVVSLLSRARSSRFSRPSGPIKWLAMSSLIH